MNFRKCCTRIICIELLICFLPDLFCVKKRQCFWILFFCVAATKDDFDNKSVDYLCESDKHAVSQCIPSYRYIGLCVNTSKHFISSCI